ncbi:MAG: universal stress protein [Acidobacteriota bacterium]
MDIGDILVPVDFSDCSLRALDFALSLVSEDGEIYLLHVIDNAFLDRVAEHSLGEREEVTTKLRSEAEARLDSVIADKQAGEKINKMIVIGIPFVEILRIAKDLDFSLIAMGIRGSASPLEQLLFGGTADKVLRGTQIPVICVP